MADERRIERDTMGEVEVPASAYYGAQTARARDNFPIGGGRIPRLVIRALGLIKGAAAEVNASLGDLDDKLASAIRQAADEVAEGRWDDEFVVDVFQTGSGTSSNMNANEVIGNRAAELLGHPLGSGVVHPNDHVNMGQSSNDVFPTALQLALALGIRDQLLPRMRHLAECLHTIADRTFDAVKTGRTHLMDAMPIRFGQEFRGHAGHVERAVARIEAASGDLLEVPLGGTAVGTGVNARDGFAAAVCAAILRDQGIALRETDNHFQAQACVDPIVLMSGTLRAFATSLFKVTNDIRWMASGPLCGLGEVRIPAVQPGSSIMPAKVNPVICESVLMVCGQVMANDAAVAFGNSQGQFELNTMLPLIGRNAVESVVLLANGCDNLRRRCLEGLEITDVARDKVIRNPILATALNRVVGYDKAAAIAKEAARTGRTVREVAEEMTDLTAAQLDDLLDPARLCGDSGRRP